METWVPLDQEKIISTGQKILLPAQQNNRLIVNYGSGQADILQFLNQTQSLSVMIIITTLQQFVYKICFDIIT